MVVCLSLELFLQHSLFYTALIVLEGEEKAKHSNEEDDLPSLYIHFLIYYRKYIKINNDVYIRSYMYMCVIKVIETARILDESKIPALFCLSFYREGNYSLFIWQASLKSASLNQAIYYQVLRIVSMMNKPGGFFVKEASVN